MCHARITKSPTLWGGHLAQTSYYYIILHSFSQRGSLILTLDRTRTATNHDPETRNILVFVLSTLKQSFTSVSVKTKALMRNQYVVQVSSFLLIVTTSFL